MASACAPSLHTHTCRRARRQHRYLRACPRAVACVQTPNSVTRDICNSSMATDALIVNSHPPRKKKYIYIYSLYIYIAELSLCRG